MTLKVKKYTEMTVIIENQVIMLKAVTDMAMIISVIMVMEMIFKCHRLND